MTAVYTSQGMRRGLLGGDGWVLGPCRDSPLFRSSAATQYPRRAASVAGRWEFLNAFVEDRRWQMDKQTPPK
ncbi:hypothetical protein PG988_007671 [Apiospora saccharicola]